MVCPMSRVHVGIVTYNSLADLAACLNSLQSQTYPDITVTPLDNASQDGSLDWLRQHGIPVIASSVNVGFARAHNLLVRQCKMTADSYYLPLNPDVTLTPGYIAALAHLMEEKGAGWVMGKLLLS